MADDSPAVAGQWRALVLLSLAELLGMTLWFSASAVVPALTGAWNLNAAGQAWLTMSVQAGFVAGTLVSALLNLADLFNARRLFALSAVAGAACNAAIAAFASGLVPAVALRFATGFFLAGVYPPGMKIMAGWFRRGRGMAIGVLVGALTLGSATPHLLKVAGSPDWRGLMYTASALAVAGGLLCLTTVGDGPYLARGARFDWRYAARVLRDPAVRLANFGYLGHMWELYAVWTWVPLFLYQGFVHRGLPQAASWGSLAGFAVIGVGFFGCAAAGILADRYGRTTVTIVAMAVSGLCCLVAGPLFGAHPALVVGVCLVWGVAVVADSAQFSTAVTELAEPAYVGSALTLQTCLGFLLTMASIRLIPTLVEHAGWGLVFASLAPGPALGIAAMACLRRRPEAALIGGERR